MSATNGFLQSLSGSAPRAVARRSGAPTSPRRRRLSRWIASQPTTFGGLQLAVNNSAISHPPTAFHELDFAVFDRVMEVNLKGVLFGMKAQLQHFRAAGGGAIVNTSSGAGMKATLGQPAYSVAKAGINRATRQAALENARENIRINCVAPGLIDTPLLAGQPEEVREFFRAAAHR